MCGECHIIALHSAGTQCDVILLARNLEGLQETKSLVLANAPGINTHLIQADLGNLDELHRVFSDSLRLTEGRKHGQAVLIHNAASLGDITKPIKDHTDPSKVQDYMAANFTSMFTLTSLFLSHFTEGFRTVVNITSLLAVNYNYCFGFYSPGKAARNALMGVLAAENPDVRVISYSPAVADTDMLRSLGEKSYSSEVTEGVKGLYEKKIVLTCQQTVAKLVEVLEEDKFENGSLVDYFDEAK